MDTPLREAAAASLEKAGYSSQITGWQRISSGSINQAARIITPQGEFFLKWHTDAPAGFFQKEAEGLHSLAQHQAARVPDVIAWGDAPAFLLLEWLPTQPITNEAAAELGRQLAGLHQQAGPFYGLAGDNFIGSLPQHNRPASDWATFYTECRLLPQMELAGHNGLLPATRRQRLNAVITNIAGCFEDGEPLHPAPLHGDLWGGNWLTGPGGQPVLIDPAFYRAYEAMYPLPPSAARRVPLYQLYYLLVHLNLFGEGYGPQVDAAARQALA